MITAIIILFVLAMASAYLGFREVVPFLAIPLQILFGVLVLLLILVLNVNVLRQMPQDRRRIDQIAESESEPPLRPTSPQPDQKPPL